MPLRENEGLYEGLVSWMLKLLLGGSWRVISRVTILITHIRRLITPLITTHESPSRSSSCEVELVEHW